MEKELLDAIQQAKRGGQDAFSRIYEATSGYCYFVARRLLSNDQDAADILQESYLAAFGAIAVFDEGRDLKPWLGVIVRNKCLNFLSRKKESSLSCESMELAGEDESFLPAEYLMRAEKRREILEIIDRLPTMQRTATVLFYMEGMSSSEIAVMLGCTDNAVKANLFHARKKIKAAVLQEEQNGNRLYSALPITVLGSIFAEEADAAQIPAEINRQLFQQISRWALSQSSMDIPQTEAPLIEASQAAPSELPPSAPPPQQVTTAAQVISASAATSSVPPPQGAAPAIKFCIHCGGRIGAGSFCPSCGEQVYRGIQQMQNAAASAAQASPPQAQQPDMPPTELPPGEPVRIIRITDPQHPDYRPPQAQQPDMPSAELPPGEPVRIIRITDPQHPDYRPPQAQQPDMPPTELPPGEPVRIIRITDPQHPNYQPPQGKPNPEAYERFVAQRLRGHQAQPPGTSERPDPPAQPPQLKPKAPRKKPRFKIGVAAGIAAAVLGGIIFMGGPGDGGTGGEGAPAGGIANLLGGGAGSKAQAYYTNSGRMQGGINMMFLSDGTYSYIPVQTNVLLGISEKDYSIKEIEADGIARVGHPHLIGNTYYGSSGVQYTEHYYLVTYDLKTGARTNHEDIIFKNLYYDGQYFYAYLHYAYDARTGGMSAGKTLTKIDPKSLKTLEQWALPEDIALAHLVYDGVFYYTEDSGAGTGFVSYGALKGVELATGKADTKDFGAYLAVNQHGFIYLSGSEIIREAHNGGGKTVLVDTGCGLTHGYLDGEHYYFTLADDSYSDKKNALDSNYGFYRVHTKTGKLQAIDLAYGGDFMVNNGWLAVRDITYRVVGDSLVGSLTTRGGYEERSIPMIDINK